jgi:hypothetical protein
MQLRERNTSSHTSSSLAASVYRRALPPWLGAVLVTLVCLAPGCGGGGDAGNDMGAPSDAGSDMGAPDAGPCLWYLDDDGDGYGSDDVAPIESCEPRVGRVERGGDCDDGVATISPGARELCDAVDNDCDGTTNEGFMLGSACTGTGECGAGTVECLDMDTTVCSTDIGGSASAATTETCDALDNDCDGDTDEDVVVGEACPAVGECGAGVTECSAAGSIVCSTQAGGSASQATDELCDGLDNDCDGPIDETFATGEACNGLGACGVGQVECLSDTETVCSTEPGGTQNQAAANDLLCNGVDDDCDGTTDEDRGVGDACTDACGPGVVECATLNTIRCSSEGSC